MKTRITLVLALLLSLNVMAAPTKKVKKTKKADAAAAVTEPKADTLTLKDFSYAIGVANTQGIKAHLANNLGMDTVKHMADFSRALKEVIAKQDDPAFRAYAIGLQIGIGALVEFPKTIDKQITGKDTTFIDIDSYRRGFLDAVGGDKLPYSVDSAARAATKQMQYYANQKTQREYGQNKKDGEDFLAQNGKLADVKTTPSGLQYKIIKEGNGPKPKADQTVKVNYSGRLIDGTVFDSNTGKDPFQVQCNHVIAGWTEALTMMPVGSKWEIYIPQQLAYGEREAGKIKPFSALIFEVELLEIVGAANP
ncbi:MAG: FKBP-type peptidyl-prolyl cis-trans isomerase [Bacteroidaceae bacterium]|nr:FKBP-type peptidyl-prolyl cis-trans isomerase [Bacteroidaceae bacterium]